MIRDPTPRCSTSAPRTARSRSTTSATRRRSVTKSRMTTFALPGLTRESPPKLLHEDSSAVRGPKEYQHVNIGHINALIEKIDRGHEIKLPRPEIGT